jgi:hypothetical protein
MTFTDVLCFVNMNIGTWVCCLSYFLTSLDFVLSFYQVDEINKYYTGRVCSFILPSACLMFRIPQMIWMKFSSWYVVLPDLNFAYSNFSRSRRYICLIFSYVSMGINHNMSEGGKLEVCDSKMLRKKSGQTKMN